MSERRVIGVDPDMTELAFIGVLKTVGSPALNSAHAVYQECAKRRVSPSFVLAMFQHESGFGLNGWAAKTFSWGNTRPPSFGATPEGVFDQDTGNYYYWNAIRPSGRRYLCAYTDWIDGGVSTVARFVDHPAYVGKVTVEAIIPTWAPSSDGNDTARYVAAVLAAMDQWSGVAPRVNPLSPQEAHMVNKPPMISDHTKTKFGGYLRGTRRHVLLVSHISAGTDSLAWLRDEHLDAKGDDISPSVNYLIRRDGVIIEIVDPHGPAPWTNGIDYTKFPQGKKPNLANPLIAELTRQQINPNQWSLTIEHEALAEIGLTPAQWAATTALQAWLCQEFAGEGLVPDATHLIGHNQIDGIDRPNCPGWTEAQWSALRGTVKSLLGGEAVQPQQPTPKPPAPAPSDPGFPGVVQADQSLVINGQVVPDGRAVRVERVLMQVLNEEDKQYWVEWRGHQWQPWHEGAIPLP